MLNHRIRGALVALRDRVDRVLHPGRRRRASARLAALRPSTVLFVCLGNICRSPYAARVLEARGPAGLRAESGGYLGPGRHPPSEALRVARTRGIDHADHVSALVTDEQVEKADVIFVFDRFNVRDLRRAHPTALGRMLWLGDLDPEWSGKRAIGDPWGKPIEEYTAAFVRIERCVDELVRTLGEG